MCWELLKVDAEGQIEETYRLDKDNKHPILVKPKDKRSDYNQIEKS